MRVHEFVDAIGVNIKPGEYAYSNTPAIIEDVQFLGLRQVRLGVPIHTYGFAGAFADAGFRFACVADKKRGSAESELARVVAFEKAHPGTIRYLQGLNEPLVQHVPVATAIEYQTTFFNGKNADPLISHIPLTSMVGELGDQSAICDRVDAHTYPTYSHIPHGAMQTDLSVAWKGAPGKPATMSEYNNATGKPGKFFASEETQARFVLSGVTTAVAEFGVECLYIYQLYDGLKDTDPAKPNWANHCGLFTNDRTPKLAAKALHNLTTILADPHADVVKPRYGIAKHTLLGLDGKANVRVRELPLLRGDAVTMLLISSDLPTVDTDPPVPTTMVLRTTSSKHVKVYDPVKGTAPITDSAVVNRVSSKMTQLTFTGETLVVELAP